jgi:hypothetical protein
MIHIFHNWSKWSELVNTYSGTYQYRTCTICNKCEKREVGLNIEFNLAAWNTNKEPK